MSLTVAPPPSTSVTPPPRYQPYGGLAQIRRFTVNEYHDMIRVGILREGEPCELLEGYVVLKMARGPKHDHAIRVLNSRLVRMVPPGWQVSPQTAAALDDSEPEPDFTIIRGDESAYVGRHPGPADVAIAIEVSDSSLTRDTRDKARIYARAGIPVYWVVNIPDRKVEVFTQPSGPIESPAYAQHAEYPVGSAVPVVLDGNQVGTIAVADVMA
jgi:Uma2 family endonuclease